MVMVSPMYHSYNNIFMKKRYMHSNIFHVCALPLFTYYYSLASVKLFAFYFEIVKSTLILFDTKPMIQRIYLN
jgi:hypothetical protein